MDGEMMKFLRRGLFLSWLIAGLWLSTREPLFAIEPPYAGPQPTRNQDEPPQDEPLKVESRQRTYPVGEILDELMLLGMAEKDANQMLLECIGCESNRTAKVTDSTLSIVAQNVDEQERVEKNIERFRKFGFGQYRLQVDFIELLASDVVLLELDWFVAKQTAAVMSEDFRWLEQSLKPFLETPINLKGNPSIKAAVLDEERTNALNQYLKQNVRARRFGTPTQTAFNGESVTLLRHLQKPFVVGPQEPKLGHGVEPIRTNIPEGCGIRIQSIEDSDRVSVQLHGEVHWSRVLSVTDSTFQQTPLRIPTVELNSFYFNEHVPFGSTLVLLGPAYDLNGMSHHSILLVHPETSALPRPLALQSIRNLTMPNGMRVADKRNAQLKINDVRISIMGPLVAGKVAMEPPSDDEVLHAFERAGLPNGLKPEAQEPIPLTVEKLFLHEKIDPGRFVPLIGMAKLHHRLYRCTLAKPDGTCAKTITVDHCFFETF
jgi:hypothetical protein